MLASRHSYLVGGKAAGASTCSTESCLPVLETAFTEQTPDRQSAKQDQDLEGDTPGISKIDQDAQRELREYEESFDWMRIQKRQFYYFKL
ncbi:hypothetical protein BDV10DRAFT_178826 [Aspergillus recurvatus]